MTVQEVPSRLFYIRGEGSIDTAFGDEGRSMPVQNGRCLYVARLEVAQRDHSELRGQECGLELKTTYGNLHYQKGLGGAQKGWIGNILTFETLVASAEMPKERVSDQTPHVVREALDGILDSHHYNCNARIYTEFDGYHQGFGARFDENRTFAPIVAMVVREVLGHL